MPNLRGTIPQEIKRGDRIIISGRNEFQGEVITAEADRVYDATTRTWSIIGWNIQLDDYVIGYVYFKHQDWPHTLELCNRPETE